MRNADQDVHMPRLELVPEPRSDGTIVLRVVERGPLERLKRLVRDLLHR